MKVSADFICEHGMPQPWATCTECMLLPTSLRPEKPRPKPEPPKPALTKRAPKAKSLGSRPSRPTGSSGRARSATPRNSTRLPKSDVDTAPILFGAHDLAYEIPDTNLRYHIQGADKDWLPISSMPKELRRDGYVFLQTDSRLVAKCPVKGIGFRDRRWSHERPEASADMGPGATLELHGDSWEFVSINLGPEGEADTAGYRYLATELDGTVRPAAV